MQTAMKRAKKKRHLKPLQDRYITRVKGGYLVAVPAKKKGGKPSSKFFSDSAHEGRRKAQIAARAERDKLHGLMPLRYIKKGPQRNSTTKILGVFEVTMKRVHHGRKKRSVYEIPIAVGSYINKDGKEKRRAYSINKYGREDAFNLATEFRQEGLRELRQYVLRLKASALRSRLEKSLHDQEQPPARRERRASVQK